MRKIMISTVAATILASSALAADIPQKYIDIFGDMALAVTASQMCGDVSLNQEAFDAQGASISEQAKADGMSDAQIEDMIKSLEADPNVLMGSMMVFGESKGVSPADSQGFCGAIKGEKSSGTRLGKMVN